MSQLNEIWQQITSFVGDHNLITIVGAILIFGLIIYVFLSDTLE